MAKHTTSTKLSKAFKDEMEFFLKSHDVKRFNRQLRYVFLDYLYVTIEEGTLVCMKEFLLTLSALFELLDKAEGECISPNDL